RKRIGASNPAAAALNAVTPMASYNGDALPDEAEINTMDEAELRQAMLSLVRRRKPAHAPSSAESPSLAVAASTSSCSTTSGNHSEDLGDSAVPAGHVQIYKRHRNDSDASDASQRMGIDLLLNASSFSDRHSSNRNDQLSMSPPSYSEYRSSPPTTCLSSSPPAYFLPPPNAVDSYWRDLRRPFTLPPISQLEIRDPTGLGSPPSDCMSSASSLEQYKISTRYTKEYISYAHSYPPPLSATRSLTSMVHHPSPPASHHSSPTAYSSSQGAPGTQLQPEAIPMPAPAATTLPPPSDIVEYAASCHRQPYSTSPPLPSCSQLDQGTRHRQPQQPQPRQSPPHTSYVSFSQAQSYFAQQHIHPHAALLPNHQTQVQLQPQTQTQTQTQSIPISSNAPALTAGVVRNISKPKFNYAFLDTKRPRGPSSRWSPNEDELLKSAVREFGEDRQWVKVAQSVPGRTNLQCRQRWLCNIKAQVEKERGIK
ncbi:myb-like DNA-binding protein bas1, partial [Coemansia sp. BCRC 34301]